MERTAARKQMCSPVRGCLAQQLRPAYRMHTGDSSASRSEQTRRCARILATNGGRRDPGLSQSKRTGAQHPADVRQRARFLARVPCRRRDGELDKPSLDELQESLLEDFRLHLSERGYSRFTVRTYMAALAGFIDYLLVHDLLPPTFSWRRRVPGYATAAGSPPTLLQCLTPPCPLSFATTMSSHYRMGTQPASANPA